MAGTSRSPYPDLPCQVPLDLFNRICHARYFSICLPGSAMAGTSRSLYPDLPCQILLDLFTRRSAMLDPLNLFTWICHGRYLSISLPADLPCQVPLNLFTRICHGRYISISLPGSAMPDTSRSLHPQICHARSSQSVYPDLPWQVPLDLFTRICHSRYLSICFYRYLPAVYHTKSRIR
jgi:hypothetical protein